MKKLSLYYATNRKHMGKNRWAPRSYGTEFSRDGMQNLRFGEVTVSADEDRIERCLKRNTGYGEGDGEKLSTYLSKLAGSQKTSKIKAYFEKLQDDCPDSHQPSDARWGRDQMFGNIQKEMIGGKDVLVYIHGFNVEWKQAVGATLALQEMLNRKSGIPTQEVMVVLFSWPSDGNALPFVSYKSDREDARGSGSSFGRAFLKLRDFLMDLRRGTDSHPICKQKFHLLCHSMGNYVLQNALDRIIMFTPRGTMPRIFENIFMCAPDVDDNVLEPGNAMGRLHEICRGVNVYYNRGDVAMHVSDYTKGNPDRLGTNGAARPSMLHTKMKQVDCSDIIDGFVEHSYYLSGRINDDIRLTIADEPQGPSFRSRTVVQGVHNSWIMR